MFKPLFAQAGSAARAHLRILGTTDLHMQLMPWDYLADAPSAATGLALTARLIRQMRAGADNCLLFDNGDFLQGSPLTDLDPPDQPPGKAGADPPRHPMIEAMNLLSYDAGTLGNHDFDHGVGSLQAVLRHAGFPVVLANIRARAGAAAAPAPVAPPFALLRRTIRMLNGETRPLCLGVIGFAPPAPALWDHYLTRHLIETDDIVESARRLVPQLRAAGAQIVVALAHSGINDTAHTPLMENAAVPLAAVPGIDAVLAGHTHRVFPGPGWPRTDAIDPDAGRLHGKPAVMAGFHGSHLGMIDLLIGCNPQGRWEVLDSLSRALAVNDRALPARAGQPGTDPTLQQALARGHDMTLRRVHQTVGTTTMPLHSFFSRIAPDAAMAVLADAFRAAAAPLLQGRPESALPVVVAVAPARSGGAGGVHNYVDIAPGPVSLRHVAGLCPHLGALTLLDLSGAQIAQWLERSASGFARITPGQPDQPLFDLAFPPYLSDQIDGLTYAVNPSAPARTGPAGQVIAPQATRISDIRLHGSPLRPGDRVVLVTDSFRAGGGGGYDMARTARRIAQGPVSTRDALLQWLGRGPLTVAPRPGWRMAPLPGTSAWFDSAPAALAHMTCLPGRDLADLGPAPLGFRRFALRFGDAAA